MKYNEKNKPLVCMMTQSTCYKGTRKFEPKGVLWHSTGANNPSLKRYVQPDDKAADKAEMIAKLGKNQYGNDWNHVERQAGLNFWIGKLADGTVSAVQTMPWDYRPWGCGSGSKGSCNDTHIQFEICEDGLNDNAYFDACYKEACEVTAYLCKMYGIDPKGTIDYKGLKVPTIIDHSGSHSLGLGSNHADIQHWSKRYGKTMDNVREDVAALLAAETTAPANAAVGSTPEVSVPVTNAADAEKTIWDTLYAAIGNAYGTAGLMGNLKAESALKANNLQNNGNTKLGMTDEEFTAAYDNGEYPLDTFIHDGFGYGLAQWTYYSRKAALAAYAKEQGASIGELSMQLGFLLKEIRGYTSVWNTLVSAASVREASDAVLMKFERPANQSESVQVKRAGYGEVFLARYGTLAASQETSQDKTEDTAVPATRYYRVRKSWADRSSQIGAFTVFQNAKLCVDVNPGYAAFDDNGNLVYPQAVFQPYLIRIAITNLNFRKGPGLSFDSYGYIEPGVYTIVDEQDGWGLLKAYASQRNGWVMLSYTSKI